jgi:hypothetical protein
VSLQDELTERMNRKAEELATIIARETQSLVARFMVETGLKASEIELVTHYQGDKVVVYPRKRGL